MRFSVIFIFLFSLVNADNIREIYRAQLSYKDHYNSSGHRLETVASILRQDRANYHKFHRRDSLDTGDKFFALKENRAVFERILQNSYISNHIREEILYGEPTVIVTIYFDDSISIKLY